MRLQHEDDRPRSHSAIDRNRCQCGHDKKLTTRSGAAKVRAHVRRAAAQREVHVCRQNDKRGPLAVNRDPGPALAIQS